MHAFADLLRTLESGTSADAQVAELAAYFRSAPTDDAAWAVHLLSGGRPRPVVGPDLLRRVACEVAGIADWLFEASLAESGQLAETIACLLPPPGDAGAISASPASSPSSAPSSPTPPAAPAVPCAPSTAGAPITSRDPSLARWMVEHLAPLRGLPETEQAQRLRADWQHLPAGPRLIQLELMSGSFRATLPAQGLARALAQAFGLDSRFMAQRLMDQRPAGAAPSAAAFEALIAPDVDGIGARTLPLPLQRAARLQADPARLGPAADWQVEWAFDGLRVQLLHRGGRSALWSQSDELLSDRFPELLAQAERLPAGTVLDGMLVVWPEAAAHPSPRAALQTRLARKSTTPKLLRESPARFVAVDLLEIDGQDLRREPLRVRRARLDALAATHGLTLSPALAADSWADRAALRAQARAHGCDGLVIKRLNACYGDTAVPSTITGHVGATARILSTETVEPAEPVEPVEPAERTERTEHTENTDHTAHTETTAPTEPVWWTWPIEPMCIDAVLVYAETTPGARTGGRSYSFALWNRAPADAAEAESVVEAIRARQPATPGALQLVTVAKAHAGLDGAALARIDRVIQDTAVERFGPVRSLAPSLVLELAFTDAQPSKRHRCGFVLRDVRMQRIRDDKRLHEAATLDDLRERAGTPPPGADLSNP